VESLGHGTVIFGFARLWPGRSPVVSGRVTESGDTSSASAQVGGAFPRSFVCVADLSRYNFS
jgi:hypothetical protein